MGHNYCSLLLFECNNFHALNFFVQTPLLLCSKKDQREVYFIFMMVYSSTFHKSEKMKSHSIDFLW
jgi:hypothetical protein